jgi:hypothetical protein
MDTGRWTILSRATSQPRRPSQPYLRAKVNVLCVCGVQRAVWLEDIEQKRSMGCESPRCRNKFAASGDVREMLTEWINAQLEALRKVSRAFPAPVREQLEQSANELYAAQMKEIDDGIAEWLRAPADEDAMPYQALREGLSRGA